jgi:plastocyanin
VTVALAILVSGVSLLIPIRPVNAQDAGVTDVQVQVVDFTFEPAALTIPAGATVTWTNAGSRPHTVTADDGAFDSGRLDPGEQFSHTFDQPGTFTYHCGFHPDMQGSIVVTAAEPELIAVATPAAEQPVRETGEQSTASTAGPSQNLVPVEQPRLAHIHAGTCDELGIVVYSLPDLRSYRIDESDSGVGAVEVIEGTTQAPLSALFGEPFSIHVHESARNKQTYIACADIGGRPGAPWTESDGITLESREQNDSGFSGFTTLRPAANGGTGVTIALAASPAAVESAASEAPPPPSATYTSPSFGYAIGYGPTWQESENASTNGRDRFVLFNGTSYITFTGERAFNGDPQACVDAFVDQLTADPNVSNLALAVDEEGNPLQGGTEATGSYAIYDHDYTFPDRVEPYTLFVGCIPLVPNEAVLAIVQNVPAAQYDDQVEPREALLRGLTLNQ